jgi:DNA-binding LacI/PurR family transcriptional regulator
MGRPRGSAVRYQEIAARLANRMRRGTWQRGFMLPSYSELAGEFKTSVRTIVRVLEHLALAEKIGRTPQGKWKVRAPEQALDLNANRVVLVLSADLKACWQNTLGEHYLVRKGLELGLAEKRRQLQIVSRYYYNRKINEMVVPGLLEAGIHGALLLGNFSRQCQRQYAALKLPVVLVDAPPFADRLASVCVANEAAAFDAVQRLAHLGHRRIAFCRRVNTTLSEIDPDSAERQNGFLRGLKNCGIPNGGSAVFNFINGNKRPDAAPLRAILSAQPRFTAVLAVDGGIAGAVAKAAKAHGLILPRDLSIAAFGGPDSVWSGPRIDFERVGRAAVELLESRAIKQVRVPAIWSQGSTLDRLKLKSLQPL